MKYIIQVRGKTASGAIGEGCVNLVINGYKKNLAIYNYLVDIGFVAAIQSLYPNQFQFKCISYVDDGIEKLEPFKVVNGEKQPVPFKLRYEGVIKDTTVRASAPLFMSGDFGENVTDRIPFFGGDILSTILRNTIGVVEGDLYLVKSVNFELSPADDTDVVVAANYSLREHQAYTNSLHEYYEDDLVTPKQGEVNI